MWAKWLYSPCRLAVAHVGISASGQNQKWPSNPGCLRGPQVRWANKVHNLCRFGGPQGWSPGKNHKWRMQSCCFRSAHVDKMARLFLKPQTSPTFEEKRQSKIASWPVRS